MGLWLGIQYLAFISAMVIGVSMIDAGYDWQTIAFAVVFAIVWPGMGVPYRGAVEEGQ